MQKVVFTPAGPPTIITTVFGPATFAMPPVDADAPDLVIVNGDLLPISLCWGGHPASHASGQVIVPGHGRPVLVTRNPDALAASVTNPLVARGDSADGGAELIPAAEEVSIFTANPGGKVTIQRGTVAAVMVF